MPRIDSIATPFLALAFTAAASAGLIDKTWAAGMNGSWNVHEHWLPFGVPNNSGSFEYHAIIDSGFTVTLELSVDVTSLTVSPGCELNVVDSRHLRVYDGAIINEGMFRLAAVDSNTELVFGGTGTVPVTSADGTGVIELQAATSPGYAGLYGTGFSRIINGSGHTIRGAGRLGQGSLSVTNEGMVLANIAGERLSVRPPSSTIGDFTNNGLMRAEGGGILFLERNHHTTRADFLGSGTITAADGSLVELDAYTRLVGVTLATEGSGEVRGVVTQGMEFMDIANTGALVLEQNVSAIFAGAIANSGTITFATIPPGVGAFKVSSLGDVELTGGGTIDLGEGGLNEMYAVSGTNPRLTNHDNTITGAGKLGRNQLSITNGGTVAATSATAPMVIDPPSGGDFTNTGAIEVNGAGGLTIAAGTFTTSGTVFIAEGSTASRTGSFPQTGGALTVDGALTVTGGAVLLSGGTIGGAGTITGGVTATGGSIEPGHSPGTLAIVGTYAPSDAAELVIEVAGPDPGIGHDVLAITGNATLGGALRVVLLGGSAPPVGTELTILSASGAVSGAFDTLDLPAGAVVSYTRAAVLVSWPGPGCPDLDGDGSVGFNDLVAVLAAWGPCAGCPADFDGDGAVGFDDLITLLAAWGAC